MAVHAGNCLPISALPDGALDHGETTFQIQMHERSYPYCPPCTARWAYTKLCTNGVLTANRIAHTYPFEYAGILHCNMSAGNILVIKEGKEPAKGLLIDGELGKNVDEGGSRWPEHMVSLSVQSGTHMLNLTGGMAIYVYQSALTSWQDAYANEWPCVTRKVTVA